MTPGEWMHLAGLALTKGAKAAREGALTSSDEATRHALEESAEYMEAILDLRSPPPRPR